MRTPSIPFRAARLGRWAATGLGLILAAAAAAAEPSPAPPADEPPPDEMRSLHLTDLQRRILEQAFHRAAFEAPAPPAPNASFGVKVEPVAPGGLVRLGSAGDLPARLTITVGTAARRASVHLRYVVQDFYGRKVADGTLPAVFPDAAGMASADLTLKELKTFGYYHVLVTATLEGESATGACGLAFVHPFEKGADAKSPFGVLAPPGKIDPAMLDLCRRLGVRRLALDYEANADLLDAIKQADLTPTAIVRFDIPQKDPAPAAFAAAQGELIHQQADAVRDWQIGRRPILGGDSLTDAAASYREVVSGVTAEVRRRQAPATIWVGATPDLVADVLTEGPVLAGVDGVALTVEAGAAWPNLRSGAYRRWLDFGLQMARRAGVKRAVVAGTGDDPAFSSAQQRAWKLVTRHVLALAAGAEGVYMTWDRGIPSPLPSAAAYAWMAHLLDGAKYEGQPWDDIPLLEAHLFAGPERRAAVVWSWVGEDPANPDRGALVFENGTGLEALDVVGHPVGIWKGPRLIVPLGEAPIYIVSGELKVGELRDRLRGAKILGVQPASLHIQSLTRGEVPGRATVTLVVQSHRPHRLDGIAGLLAPEGWAVRQKKQTFALDPGQAREVSFECDVPAEAGPPPWPIEAVASFNEEYIRHAQVVWPAQATERTIEVGYGLKAWEDLPAVTLRSASGDTRAEVRTAWDATHFYFCAALYRERASFRTGPLPGQGDAIQLAWGTGDRADDDFGHRAKGLALPAGAFRDTDHLMAITFGKDGAQVVRLRAPRVVLRDHVPGNMDPWFGPVEGSTAAIAREQEAGRTLVEAAIPWKALAPLSGRRGQTMRFGFRIGDAAGPPLEWARAAAVPDYLANPCSFVPTSFVDGLPCQTWWGLAGEKK